jgi:hypothetical protein
MNRDRPLLAYFGHHKAASDWAHKIVRDACEAMGLKYVYVHHPRQFDSDLKAFVEREGIDFLTYANADREMVQDCLAGLRGFHMVRDPRDIAVSGYFSHLYSHTSSDFPRLHDHRERLRKASREEGLLLELEFERPNFERMYTWDYSLPNVLELKMERVTQEAGDSFCRIFSSLSILDEGQGGPGPKIGREKLLAVVEKYNFTNQSGGRKPGEEDPRNHYRKGVPGDWKNHFTERCKDFFKKNYNDLLLKLGYEKDGNW